LPSFLWAPTVQASWASGSFTPKVCALALIRAVKFRNRAVEPCVGALKCRVCAAFDARTTFRRTGDEWTCCARRGRG
jgi:hypothetical protein